MRSGGGIFLWVWWWLWLQASPDDQGGLIHAV